MSTEYARVGGLIVTQFCGSVNNISKAKGRLMLQLTTADGGSYVRMGVAEVRELRDQLGKWLIESQVLRNAVSAGGGDTHHVVHAADEKGDTLCGREVYADASRRYDPDVPWCPECSRHPRFQRCVWKWREWAARAQR